jgi:hypothetical protein
MVYRSTLIRTVRRIGICLVVSFVVLIVFLRVEAYRFQNRAERLMVDVQALKLRQSNWLEAERLISRWGKYGNYKGHCDASFCRYSIALDSPAITFGRAFPMAPLNLKNHFVYQTASLIFTLSEYLAEYLGVRVVTVRATFVVQDRVVLRKSAVFIYDVALTFSGSPYSLSLIATSRATSRLTSGGWPLIWSEQLAEHPFYAFTRPGGCSSCLMVNVTFTPDTPGPEMRRLTTFNLSCITRLRPCRYLEDIYPAAEDWHLYDGTVGGRPLPPNQAHTEQASLPLACRVPLFARGREAGQILSVTALSESQERQPGEVTEKATVRLNGVPKGETGYKPGELIAVTSRSGDWYSPPAIETPLIPGKQFLFLTVYREDKSHPLELDRCLVLPDTPEIRNQLEAGVAQNDNLRYPDPHSSDFIPY